MKNGFSVGSPLLTGGPFFIFILFFLFSSFLFFLFLEIAFSGTVLHFDHRFSNVRATTCPNPGSENGQSAPKWPKTPPPGGGQKSQKICKNYINDY